MVWTYLGFTARLERDSQVDLMPELSDWETSQGDHWAAHADRYTRMLAPYGELVTAAAGYRAGERVLDVGCGNGDLSVLAGPAVQPGGLVLGIDLSPAELAVAATRADAAGVTGVTFSLGDAASERPASAPFDVVVSRFGVMFFPDPVAAFTNLRSLLAPGGRMALVCWRELLANDWMTVPAAAIGEVLPLPAGADPSAPGPFAFADRDRVEDVLRGAGLVDVRLSEVSPRIWMGADAGAAADFIRGSGLGRAVFAGVDPALEAEAMARATAALAAYETPDGVWLGSAAWLVTARA